MGRELSIWLLGSAASRDLPCDVLRDAGFAVHASNGPEQPPARRPGAVLVVGEDATEATCREAHACFADVPLARLQRAGDMSPSDAVFEYIEPTPGLTRLPEELRAVCHRWSRIGVLKETARILQQVESTADLAYFAVLIGIFLLLTKAAVESVRWR